MSYDLFFAGSDRSLLHFWWLHFPLETSFDDEWSLVGVAADLHTNANNQARRNKKLAIANRSCVSCAHNTLRASIGINITPWPWKLKCRLRVIQGHWKRNHWIDHTRLSSSRVIWRNTIVTLKCGLEVTEGHWKWYHLQAWVRFPIRLL